MGVRAGGACLRQLVRGPTAAPLVIGCLSLAAGALVYLTDRSAAHTLLLPAMAPLSDRPLFGILGHWLPSFVHALAFSLFSAALLAPRLRWQYGACAFWFAVNAAFEIGQHPLVRGPLTDALGQLPGPAPVTRALERYFLRGTFDPGDLAAAALGAALAAGILYRLRPHPENGHAP